MFRGRFSTNIAWAGFRVVVVDRFDCTVKLGYNEIEKCDYFFGSEEVFSYLLCIKIVRNKSLTLL